MIAVKLSGAMAAPARKEKPMETNDIQADAEFSAAEQDAVYKCIFNRRDVRGQFLPDPIPDQVLARLLTAAHLPPPAVFMRPWAFIPAGDTPLKRGYRIPFQPPTLNLPRFSHAHTPKPTPLS